MSTEQDLQEFMSILRRALYMIIHWIEKRYGWGERDKTPR